jgi:hypothetical protein
MTYASDRLPPRDAQPQSLRWSAGIFLVGGNDCDGPPAKRRVCPALKESSVTNFGLLIAFLLPGFVALLGVSYVSEPVRLWFGASQENAPSVGGFLYVTLASVVAGLTASTVRWIVIDTLHHVTGIARPALDYSRLRDNVAALDMLTEFYYRYYQFYANMVVALLFATVMRHVSMPISLWPFDAMIAKYYTRSSQLLSKRATAPSGAPSISR